VAAALLHDVGHLVAEARGTVRARLDRDDDHHERVGARVLAAVFGPAVAAPVALHVQAKRWRCAVEPAYLDALSPASTATLVAQGGPLDDGARRRFEAHPAHGAALALREWDDRAKVPDLDVPPLAAYRPLLDALAAG
jgi:gamma-butyrobetaine dioxygenase